VIAGYDDLRVVDPLEPGRCFLELPVVAVGGQVTCDDDRIWIEPVEARDDRVEVLGGEAQRSADVDVADLRNSEWGLRDCRGCLLRRR
jgi:hypothetical protein